MDATARPTGAWDGVPRMYEDNHRRLAAALKGAGFDVCDANGGYFVVADCKGREDMDVMRRLSGEVGVAAMPMRFFFVPQEGGDVPTSLVRFGICKEASTIDEAVARLKGFSLED